jgi:hypothetical protein
MTCGSPPCITSAGNSRRYLRSAIKPALPETEPNRAFDAAFDPLDSVIKRKLLQARAQQGPDMACSGGGARQAKSDARDVRAVRALAARIHRRSDACVLGTVNPRQCIRREIRWKICMGKDPCRGRKSFAMPFETLHKALDHVAAYAGDHIRPATRRLEDVIDDDRITQAKRRECLGHNSECLIKAQ